MAIEDMAPPPMVHRFPLLVGVGEQVCAVNGQQCVHMEEPRLFPTVAHLELYVQQKAEQDVAATLQASQHAFDDVLFRTDDPTTGAVEGDITDTPTGDPDMSYSGSIVFDGQT